MPRTTPQTPFFHSLQQGKVKPGVLAGVIALLAVAGGGAWWYQQKQAAAIDPSASAAAKPGAQASGGRSGRSGRMGPGGPGGMSQAQPVSVGVVEQRDMRVLISAIGTMSARATAVVRAKVSGELLKLHFKEGDEVKAGQLLAEIDPRSFAASLAQMQGSLVRDQAQLKNAQLDLQRYRELLKQDSIASQQVDTQEALVRQLLGTVAADQGQVDAAKLQLSYTKVTAPISGRLGLRQADLGNVVNPSDANGLVTITQVRPIDAAFSIPEAHIGTLAEQLRAGQAMPVELWDREQKKMLAKGKLNALDNTIDTTTGTVKAKAAFDNADGHLFANQFVNVKLQVRQIDQALVVPANAVQNNYVYLVKPDNTVTQRKITVGVADGDYVSVRGDLQPGDKVVTDGIDRLREGAQVNVVDSDKVKKVDQAVQDAASQPRGAMRNLTPEQREKIAKMTPEERKEFFQKLRAERGGKGGSTGAAPAQQDKAGGVDQPKGPQEPGKSAAEARPAAEPAASGRGEQGEGRGDRPQLTPEQRAKLEALSPEERRAFFQKLRAERAARAEGASGADSSSGNNGAGR
ncbi:MAG: MdtA/MuxA family multidrug efflux RND transporter periplasmic adaptor subunit [Comamonas sp.]|jgi:multidrug efflux system membrane fusion protein|uniref:MdtA/MuxA family multidrug efflux RND transporter periplasmic adaptor subunit n=1 Tax=Comamonas sp. TaxID=34028 RepID=UPI0028226E10|nr:MdtA/MuxA family multidrug efflux RND transporter periplasmic adaptor subunit [Comamonas sp.]MDR0213097.1 MdtA/MuxA family multidrug efflux RND transporter periplasmic adaptor subunit [Comamonas sp.]